MNQSNELESYIILGHNEYSRTYAELLEAVPEPHRGLILSCAGPGTSLFGLLEYVARFAEARTAALELKIKELQEWHDSHL